MNYVILCSITTIIALLLTPIGMKIGKKYGIVAIPGGRRKHQGVIPRFGGFAIFIAYAIGIVILYQWMPPEPNASLPRSLFFYEDDHSRRLAGICLGTIVVFIGGVLDDKFDLSFRTQLLFQITGALIANAHIVFLERISNPFASQGFWDGQPEIIFAPWFAWVITTIWIVGMMNAVNWLDGLDGLAGGVGMIALLLFGFHAWTLGQTTVAGFPIILAGALAGFLFFNFAPAKLFLGSAGVYILGYNLATLAFLAPAKTATALLVLALPLLDGVWRIIDRIRNGNNPFQGDRGHLHFMLLDRGWPVRKIVLFYYFVTTLLGFTAILIPSGPIKVIIVLLVGFGLLGFLIWFTAHEKTQEVPI